MSYSCTIRGFDSTAAAVSMVRRLERELSYPPERLTLIESGLSRERHMVGKRSALYWVPLFAALGTGLGALGGEIVGFTALGLSQGWAWDPFILATLIGSALGGFLGLLCGVAAMRWTDQHQPYAVRSRWVPSQVELRLTGPIDQVCKARDAIAEWRGVPSHWRDPHVREDDEPRRATTPRSGARTPSNLGLGQPRSSRIYHR